MIFTGDILSRSLYIDKGNDSKLLNEVLMSHDIERIPLPPARITPHPETSVDIIATNLKLTETKTEVLLTGLSDHTG